MENLQNQDQQNNFTQPAQQNSKKQISTLVGLIIIIATAVILFGGVFCYQYLLIEIQPVVQTDQTIGLPVQSQQATAGWKTYTNTEYGFEFKYPNSFVGVVSDKAKSAGVFFYGKNLENLELEGYFNNEFDLKYLTSDSKFVEYNKSEVLVDGVKAYKIDSITCFMGCGASYNINIPYESGAIIIGIGKGDGSKKEANLVKMTDQEKELFNQIISTFKFTK